MKNITGKLFGEGGPELVLGFDDSKVSNQLLDEDRCFVLNVFYENHGRELYSFEGDSVKCEWQNRLYIFMGRLNETE